MTSPPETAGILLFDSEGEFIDKLVSLKSAGRFQPQGLVFGPDTNLYVSDTFTDTVQRFDANGTFRDTFAASGNPRPIGPTGAIFGPDANSDGNKDLYVSSSLGDAVLRYDGATGRFMDEFVSPGNGGLDDPRGLDFAPDPDDTGPRIPDLYVSSFGTDTILLVSGETNTFIRELVSRGAGGLDGPTGLAIRDDKLYVSSSLTDTVLRFDAKQGNLVDVFIPSGSGGLHDPRDLVFGPDPDGDGPCISGLYVSSFDTDSVLVFCGETGAFVREFKESGGGKLDGPTGLHFGSDAKLYVSSSLDDAVLRIDLVSGSVEGFVPSGSTGAIDPQGLAFGPDGSLYVSAKTTDSVLRFDAETGTPTGRFIPSIIELNDPIGLDFGPDGNKDGFLDLYVGSESQNVVHRFDGANGKPLPAVLDEQTGTTRNGAEFTNPALRCTSREDEPADPPGCLLNPADFVFGPDVTGDGVRDLYVASKDNHTVLRFNGMTGDPILQLDETGNATTAELVKRGRSGSRLLQSPIDLGFDPNCFEESDTAECYLYVSDRRNDYVRRFRYERDAASNVVRLQEMER